MPHPVVLASRSPRRLELLGLIVPPELILVRPPPSSEEESFDGLTTVPAIIPRLLKIASYKHDQTLAIMDKDGQSFSALIAGDTIVVASEPDGTQIVLGQPPTGLDQNALVRSWFREYYAGREHQVLTGVCLSVSGSRGRQTRSFVVSSLVRMLGDVEPWLDWYLETGESVGKAGGYALQGAASLFIDQVTGSLSNVVGLPIREVKAALVELGLDVGHGT